MTRALPSCISGQQDRMAELERIANAYTGRQAVQYGEREPLVIPQVFAPEAQRTLAGGGARA